MTASIRPEANRRVGSLAYPVEFPHRQGVWCRPLCNLIARRGAPTIVRCWPAGLPLAHLASRPTAIIREMSAPTYTRWRREGVTEAALKLQRAGVITYARGHITVLDRAKLEELSCECYAVVKKEYDRLLPAQTTH